MAGMLGGGEADFRMTEDRSMLRLCLSAVSSRLNGSASTLSDVEGSTSLTASRGGRTDARRLLGFVI
jgi:hypothetical protein